MLDTDKTTAIANVNDEDLTLISNVIVRKNSIVPIRITCMGCLNSIPQTMMGTCNSDDLEEWINRHIHLLGGALEFSSVCWPVSKGFIVIETADTFHVLFAFK